VHDVFEPFFVAARQECEGPGGAPRRGKQSFALRVFAERRENAPDLTFQHVEVHLLAAVVGHDYLPGIYGTILAVKWASPRRCGPAAVKAAIMPDRGDL
jgi:hypothetical protein